MFLEIDEMSNSRKVLAVFMWKNCNLLLLQGAAEKSGPLNVFAVFSATVWDLKMIFYVFI